MTESPTPYQWQQLEKSASHPIWIDSAELLAQHCQHWQTLKLIAIDTEFQRVETFYPIPGLIQVADDKACYLIDPLSIEDFSALSALFENHEVLKVMHAATEDLELFLNMLGVLPAPLFDTQLAAAFLDWGFSMGLQRMLEHTLSVQIEKHETTSNWLQRPLTESQERYAALDVAYLPAIYQMQAEQLAGKGYRAWVDEENQVLLHQAIDLDPEGESYYLRFTQMWRYPEHKIAALRDLTAWREQQARKRDVPRNRILRNQALLQIVERWPRSIGELSRLDEVKKKVLREDGQTILSILKNGQKSATEQQPEPIPRPLHYFWNKHLKKLKGVARKQAETLSIAGELMLKKKELDQLVRSGIEEGEYRIPASMSQWRRELIGDQLLEELVEIEKLRKEGE